MDYVEDSSVSQTQNQVDSGDGGGALYAAEPLTTAPEYSSAKDSVGANGYHDLGPVNDEIADEVPCDCLFIFNTLVPDPALCAFGNHPCI